MQQYSETEFCMMIFVYFNQYVNKKLINIRFLMGMYLEVEHGHGDHIMLFCNDVAVCHAICGTVIRWSTFFPGKVEQFHKMWNCSTFIELLGYCPILLDPKILLIFLLNCSCWLVTQELSGRNLNKSK